MRLTLKIDDDVVSLHIWQEFKQGYETRAQEPFYMLGLGPPFLLESFE